MSEGRSSRLWPGAAGTCCAPSPPTRRGTRDPIHFERAARGGSVLVSHDIDQLKLALRWIEEGRRFRGLVTWAQVRHRRFTETAVTAFEKLAGEEDPFPAACPIRYLNVG